VISVECENSLAPCAEVKRLVRLDCHDDGGCSACCVEFARRPLRLKWLNGDGRASARLEELITFHVATRHPVAMIAFEGAAAMNRLKQ